MRLDEVSSETSIQTDARSGLSIADAIAGTIISTLPAPGDHDHRAVDDDDDVTSQKGGKGNRGKGKGKGNGGSKDKRARTKDADDDSGKPGNKRARAETDLEKRISTITQSVMQLQFVEYGGAEIIEQLEATKGCLELLYKAIKSGSKDADSVEVLGEVEQHAGNMKKWLDRARSKLAEDKKNKKV